MDFSALLNDKQYEAVQHTEGPLLIIAGAGSGKTRVLTHRIAYLMQEKGVSPWNIMAITFTNKAANEMRERVNQIAGFGAEAVWVSTFHSACARILRRYIDRIGYSNSFSIYDTDDTKQLLKNIVGEMDLDPKRYPPKRFAWQISSAKNAGITVDDMEKDAVSRDEEIAARVFRNYEEAMQKNNALDFDDLLIKTVELFESDPEVLEGYQNRLKYIMVDEYQDTNRIQFRLIRLLSEKYRNLCVVGDDDQSIYKFRGADIRNILDFERVFPEAKVVKLEQNYRSTGNILNGANSVIANNSERKEKTLWTAREDGAKIGFRFYGEAPDEARGVIGEIERRAREESWNAFAILYRTNAQSRLFEEQLVLRGIPYRLVGGLNFYARKEIKDVLAYLKTIENARDEIAVRRIINIPKRGIGERSLERISDFAGSAGMSFFDACARAKEIPGMGRTGEKVEAFSLFIRSFRSFAKEMSVKDLIEKLLRETGYREALEAEKSDEAKDRIANLDELITKAKTYEDMAEEPSLSGFLQEVALVADIDSVDENNDRVFLMTVHSAKGLEFDNVYLVGMEDGLFPGFVSIYDLDDSELQEERRLFYVGMTRARNTLVLTGARNRMVRGEMAAHKVSRFVEEIPAEYLSTGSARAGSGLDAASAGDSGFASGSEYGFGAGRRGGYGFGSEYRSGDAWSGSASGGFGSRGSGRSAPKNPSFGKAIDLNQFKLTKSDSLSYGVGDRVRHKKFGEGEVLAIKDGPKDYEVTVLFDGCGQKRMFAAFARLEKI